MPHDIYNAPHGSKRFMYASTVLALEEEAKEAAEMGKNKTRGRR